MMDRAVSASFQAVEDWLRSLGLLQYAQSFYDNGYEDIETCKMMKEEDLNVIDIKIERDRQDILSAVNKLQQNLYFELEPESTENMVERTKIEAVVLKTKLKECLEREKIQLTEPPYYNNADGSVGDLYPLAIRYAAELATFFDDVLEALTLLRKRQLPQREYDTMTTVEAPSKVKRDQENRRSLRTSSNPAEYLNCETPEFPKRSSSFSKFDTRVTKSTTDLTKDNINQSTSPKSKSKKSKGILSHVFKRGATSRSVYNHKATSEFNASELTLTQNEIVGIFEQVKNKEISQEDALNVIKRRGITKSTSYDGSSPNVLHKAAGSSNSTPSNPFQQISKEAANVAKSKTKSVKAGVGAIKSRSPSAQFYTKEDDISQSSSSLVSNDSKSSLEISGDHSGSPVEEDSISLSSKNSPEFGKPGIFKKIRNSMRKKNSKACEGEFTNGEKDAYYSNGTPPDISPTREDIVTLKPGINFPYIPDSHNHLPSFTPITHPLKPLSSFNHTNTSGPLTTLVPPPPSTPPPPPPIEDNAIPENIEDIESRGRKPSLKIKSYPMNQEEISRRRALEKNNNLTKSQNNVVIVSQSDSSNLVNSTSSTDLNLDTVHFNQPPELITELNKITPRIPPRPAPRKSESSEPLPIVPPRRSKIFRAESTDRKMDQLVKELNDITADLDIELKQVDDEDNNNKLVETTKVASNKNSIERKPPPTSAKPELPVKATTLGWKKPVPPPRPRTGSSDSIPTGGQSPQNMLRQIPLDDKRSKKLNIREVVSQKQLICKKLRKEVINLALAPYTSKDGCWCVPYNLVLRYVEELPFSLGEVIKSFDEIRAEERNKINQLHIPYSEKDLGMKKTIDYNASLEDYLIYIGLPMYIHDFRDVGCESLRDVTQLDEDGIMHVGVFDSKHITWLLRQVKSLSL